MNKKVLLSMALSATLMLSASTPLTTYAAEAKNVQTLVGKSCMVYICEGAKCIPKLPIPPVVEDTDTSDEEALSYANQVVNLVNEERAKAGLPALIMDETITAAANVRAEEIKQLFSHTRPDGSSFASVLKEHRCWTLSG